MDKLVSIIIPVYNREAIVKETLDSILNQSYTTWECILVDDGSTDGTLDVLNSYQERERRFKVFKRPSAVIKGAPSCRNYGLLQAGGEFVQFFDSDDLMLPTMLQEKVQYLNDHPEASFVVSRMGEFDEEGLRPAPDYSISSDHITLAFLRYKVYFLTPGPMFRSGLLEKFDPKFDLNLTKNQEREFYSRIMLEQPIYGTIEKIHCLRRVHEASIAKFHSTSKKSKKLLTKLSYYKRLRYNTSGRHDALLFKAYSKELLKLTVHLLRRFEFQQAFSCFSLLLSLWLSTYKA